MDPSLFDHCVGGDERYCVMAELKRIDVQPIGKGDQKPTKIDPEKRKQKRNAARSHNVAMT